jgi:hypothetical protein
VTAHDDPNGIISLTYGVACGSTDNTIVYGPLDQVSTYSYSGEECGVGNSGSFDWAYPTSSGSLFFLIVANDGSVEGSYGTDISSVERPGHVGNVLCPLPKSLSNRCD